MEEKITYFLRKILFLSYFLEENPIFVIFFGVAMSYFPIFLPVLLLDTLKSRSDNVILFLKGYSVCLFQNV